MESEKKCLSIQKNLKRQEWHLFNNTRELQLVGIEESHGFFWLLPTEWPEDSVRKHLDMNSEFLKGFHRKYCQSPTHNPLALLKMIKEDYMVEITNFIYYQHFMKWAISIFKGPENYKMEVRQEDFVG